MAAMIFICSDFGAQKHKVCHCFHCFPIYLPCAAWFGGGQTLTSLAVVRVALGQAVSPLREGPGQSESAENHLRALFEVLSS